MMISGITTSEAIATLIIWGMTAAGCFFAVRGIRRRRRKKRLAP